jgi:formyl-CoA transferase
MPQDHAIPQASTALSRFTVLDLTRVRSGPTCVRQLADWGANVIKIEMPEGLDQGDPMGGPRMGSDFQNLHRNKRGMTLNLKDKDGVALLKKLAEKADVVVENFRPDVKTRLGIDYAALSAANPRWSMPASPASARTAPTPAAGLRPDRAGHGRADVHHRPAGPGAGARRHPHRRSLRRAVRRPGHHGGAAGTRGLGPRAVGADQPAAGADLHAGLPGQPLADAGGGAEAGRQQPPDLHPTGVFKTSDGYINIAATGQRIWERCCQASAARNGRRTRASSTARRAATTATC